MTTSPFQVHSINIEIDKRRYLHAGVTMRLWRLSPYNPTQGAVVAGSWQTWDAYQGGNAIWWSTKPMGSCLVAPCFATWNQILMNYSGATILGGCG